MLQLKRHAIHAIHAIHVHVIHPIHASPSRHFGVADVFPRFPPSLPQSLAGWIAWPPSQSAARFGRFAFRCPHNCARYVPLCHVPMSMSSLSHHYVITMSSSLRCPYAVDMSPYRLCITPPYLMAMKPHITSSSIPRVQSQSLCSITFQHVLTRSNTFVPSQTHLGDINTIMICTCMRTVQRYDIISLGYSYMTLIYIYMVIECNK